MATSSLPTYSTPTHTHTPRCTHTHTYIHTNSCQKQVKSDMDELVTNMLEVEKDIWNEVQPPEQDSNGAYYTTVGIALFQMIEQNVSRSTLA